MYVHAVTSQRLYHYAKPSTAVLWDDVMPDGISGPVSQHPEPGASPACFGSLAVSTAGATAVDGRDGEVLYVGPPAFVVR